MPNGSVLAGLLGAENTTVERVNFDGDEQLLVVHVRSAATHRPPPNRTTTYGGWGTPQTHITTRPGSRADGVPIRVDAHVCPRV